MLLAPALLASVAATAPAPAAAYKVVSFPRFGTMDDAGDLYAKVGSTEARRFQFEWGPRGTGTCYVTPVPRQVP